MGITFLAPRWCPVPECNRPGGDLLLPLASAPLTSGQIGESEATLLASRPPRPYNQNLGQELHPLCEDQMESSIPGHLSQGSPGTPVPVTSDDSHLHKLSARWTELSSKVNPMGGEEVLQPESWAEASTCWGWGWGVVAGENSHSFCPHL